ncbi:hypothetical protein [Paraburkholderia tagetis]|uniref:Uncharacterized protein n=1 Tax=Paraburkholderia tagetis TaxID=2913261 RepID=A0A9X1RMD0_9BURK|nr:hypothetical protein [Paraburkholderia tagetis]MCG5073755.1 hypothetical protein [Paraburkholderia tagetis]
MDFARRARLHGKLGAAPGAPSWHALTAISSDVTPLEPGGPHATCDACYLA